MRTRSKVAVDSYSKVFTCSGIREGLSIEEKGPSMTSDSDFKNTFFSKLNISETTRDRALVTIERH